MTDVEEPFDDVDIRDDEETPELAPGENVYSYLMFASLWRQGTTKPSVDVHIAYGLAFLCLFMQGVILAAIWSAVVMKDVRWRASVMATNNIFSSMSMNNDTLLNTGNSWDLVRQKEDEGCNPGGSLCFQEDDQFTCAPPSVQLTSRWEDLDVDGDGIWTLHEAQKMQEQIKCELRVNTLEVFRVFIRFLKKRKNIIWLHPAVLAGEAIHEPYFKYAAGDIIVCGYRTADMCPNLLKRGFFDAPLTHKTVPRVGETAESALDYCIDLLKEGGFCERVLPSTYTVWKTESVEECKKPLYEPFTFTHPATGEEKSLLAVDYKARENYEDAQTPFFITYKSMIVTLWILAMVYEGRQILLILNWVIVHPHSKDGKDAVLEREVKGDEEITVKYAIRKVQMSQRVMIAVLTVARLLMVLVLAIVGTTLLLRSTSYMDIILDGVALVFVLDIASILYSQAVRPKAQEEISVHIDPMEVRLLAPEFLRRSAGCQDILWLLVVAVIVTIVMWSHFHNVVLPLYDALECTCLSEGKKCREAQLFDYEFWYEYWHKTTPAIFHDVDRLKAGSAPGATYTGVKQSGYMNLLQQGAGAALGALIPQGQESHESTGGDMRIGGGRFSRRKGGRHRRGASGRRLQ
eukprot:gnl/TRDRNA2_/TRDRNA2_153343_c0_seq4.p1 gnl/TRDRNA2_/TRDRNA2_153343_c0~~gnl/TRDRNA2_/TRDRNA2_153343_c0_seq4.p1  ORF type:complete len:669 (-),score=111.14 gnl/TRDRNA2_/TRDRNA2_153343_c0_seq4:126-2021(-)